MYSVVNKIKRKIRFYREDIWKIKASENAKITMFDLFVKTMLFGVRKFNSKGCLHKASALTYYTLLSIVPILALVFGIAKGFGYEKILEEILLRKFADKKEVLLQVFEFSNSLLENAHGGMVAGIGVVVLLWSVMKVLGNIESVLNDVWDVKSRRRAVRQLSDYFSIMLLGPVILIVSNSATIFITNYIHIKSMEAHLPVYIEWWISFGLKIIPFSFVWFGLTFLYVVMPNTKVRFKPAFVGGIIAGVMFQIVQWLYIHSQMAMAGYNAIYGSFAAIPLFLLWLQISWYIVMFGAAISNTIQNGLNVEFQNDDIILSHDQKLKLSLWIMHIITSNFEQGKGAVNQNDISKRTGMSLFLCKFLMNRLENAGLITKVYSKDKELQLFQPAVSTNCLTLEFIELKLDALYEQKIAFLPNEDYQKITDIIRNRQQSINQSEANKLLIHI